MTKKIWAQADVDAVQPDENGVRHYPARASFARRCSFGEGCSFAGWCSFAEGCVATSPYWGYVYEPPFATKGPIYPPVEARVFWEEKLGFSLGGCYQEILNRAQGRESRLAKVLAEKMWTKCERRILESWLPKKGEAMTIITRERIQQGDRVYNHNSRQEGVVTLSKTAPDGLTWLTIPGEEIGGD